MIENRMFGFVATVLLGLVLAACSTDRIPPEDAPVVKVSGSIVAADGGAPKNCKLGLYDTAALKPTLEWDVAPEFGFEFQSKAVLNKFYFRARCDGYRMAARSKIYSMDDLSHGDFTIDLARMTVGQGNVTVTGRVVTADGKTPKACTLGLYTGFHAEPVQSWSVSGDWTATFHAEDVDAHFHFELACEGYDAPYRSPQRSEAWLAESGGRIDLGLTLVR